MESSIYYHYKFWTQNFLEILENINHYIKFCV
jgi:hypothetical protein